MRPGVAAVKTLVDAIDFNAGPDGVAVPGVDDDVRGARRADGTGHGDAEIELIPGLAAIARSKGVGPRADEQGIGIGRIDRYRPDLRVGLQGVDLLPGLARVIAAKEPDIRARQHAARVVGIDRQRPDVALRGNGIPYAVPCFPAIRTTRQAPAYGADTQREILRHHVSPL